VADDVFDCQVNFLDVGGDRFRHGNRDIGLFREDPAIARQGHDRHSHAPGFGDRRDRRCVKIRSC
jgi:hypothetical protein